MRIVGGAARGRIISLPKGFSIRPTADYLKEALFSILGDVEGRYFLDLFAGCGGVGLEALSRGAGKVAFVEKDARVAAIIRNNVQSLGFSDRAELMVSDVQRALRSLWQNGRVFDVVFADPPYERGHVCPLVESLYENDLIAAGGVVIIQHSRREQLSLAEGGIEIIDQRRYGDTLLTFLKNRREEI